MIGARPSFCAPLVKPNRRRHNGLVCQMSNIEPSDGPPQRVPLSPEHLARDFGAKSDVAGAGIRACHEALLSGDNPAVQEAEDNWRTLFGAARGQNADRASAAIDALAKRHGIPSGGRRPAEIILAVQTYYALLVKLLVRRITSSFADLKIVDPPAPDPFSWYTAAPSASLEQVTRRLAAGLARYDVGTVSQQACGSRDVLKTLYEELFPKRLRHALGEYYTPDWLAEHVLDEVGYTGQGNRRLLDPSCGSGTFLVLAIDRIRKWYRKSGADRDLGPGELGRKILDSVIGFDLNPLAVMTARANYLAAIGDLLPHAGEVRIPVYLRDAILEDQSDGRLPGGRVDYVVGNPPWIAWDDLPEEYIRATKPLWQRYGLFSLSGSEARHGGGKKDLSMLMMYVAADRYLKDAGRLALVITQTLFQTKGAGDGFRRFRLGSRGAWLKVLRVNDMVDLRPFEGAANWTATILLEKGKQTSYPVPYVKWLPGGKKGDAVLSLRREKELRPLLYRRYRARPIQEDRPTSPWMLCPEGIRADIARLVGPSDYKAHLGANTGGANGVYWVELLAAAHGGVLVRNVPQRGKRKIPTIKHVVETDLLFPLLRWADVARWRAVPDGHILMVQDLDSRRGIDQSVMRREYPNAYRYLKRFADVLARRAAQRRYQRRWAFYSMYNVGTYTLWGIKVVWRRMDRRINAAVVRSVDDEMLGRRAVVPQETCVLVAVDSPTEAHYLCAMLNSSIVNFLVTSHSVRGGKGFGTPSILDFVRIRRFDADDPRHAELAVYSRRAHETAGRGEDYSEIQHQVDRLAAELWGVRKSELEVIARELA